MPKSSEELEASQRMSYLVCQRGLAINLSPIKRYFYFLSICLFDCTVSYFWHMGSLVEAWKLLIVASGIYFPVQGSSLGSLHWERSLSRWTTRQVPNFNFFNLTFCKWRSEWICPKSLMATEPQQTPRSLEFRPVLSHHTILFVNSRENMKWHLIQVFERFKQANENWPLIIWWRHF